MYEKGDGYIILWDVESKQSKTIFSEHTNDVMYFAINKKDKNLFASASVDATIKIWDMRSQGDKSIATFRGHTNDINSVAWFPDGKAFVTASDDATVKMFDMRTYRYTLPFFFFF